MGVGRVCVVLLGLCAALLVLLAQRSARVSHLNALREEVALTLAQAPAAPATRDPSAGQLWQPLASALQRASATGHATRAPRAQKQGLISLDYPNVYVLGSLVTLLYVGGPSIPYNFLEIAPADAPSVRGIVLLSHTPLLEIPTSVGRMASLSYFVGLSSLTGTVPSQIGRCTQLNALTLKGSRLSGPLPSQLGLLSATVNLHVTESLVTSMPIQLCQLTSTWHIGMENNRITGTFPPCLVQVMTPWYYLNVGGNALSGTLPDVDRQISGLRLSSNNFVGRLPNLSPGLTFQDVNVDNNFLEGTIPSQYGLVDISNLHVENNMLEGSIPSQLGLLTGTRLMLNNNRLTSSIPSQFGFGGFEYVDFSSNRLSGPLPTRVVGQDAVALDVHNNRLDGEIPSQLGVLTQLELLDLSENALGGLVPSELGLLTSLTLLDLSDNSLDGPLPSQLLLLTALEYVGLAANNFSGPLFAFPTNVTVECDYSGLEGDGCALLTPEFVSGSAFVAVVVIAAVLMACALAAGLAMVARRGSVGVVGFGGLMAALTLCGVFVACAGVVWYALASVRGSHDARSRYCQASLHLVTHGLVLIVVPAAVRGVYAWKRSEAVKNAPRASISSAGKGVGVACPPPSKPVVACAVAALVVSVALATLASADLEAADGQGCALRGNSPALAATSPLCLAVLACATCVLAWLSRAGDQRDTINIARALATAVVFGTALVVLGVDLADPLPRFMSLSMGVLVNAATILTMVHLPVLRAA